jgi:hypothetical protein
MFNQLTLLNNFPIDYEQYLDHQNEFPIDEYFVRHRLTVDASSHVLVRNPMVFENVEI